MKVLKWILIIFVVVFLGVFVARNIIIKRAVQTAIQKTTGFDLEMGKVHVGVFSPVFEVTDTTLINPEDFPERTAMEIKTLRVVYDLPSVFTKNVHLKEVTIDIPKAILIVREDGKSNLEQLGKLAIQEDSEVGDEAERKPDTDKSGHRVRIDELTLRLGTLEMRQYSEGESAPSIDSYDLDFDRTAHDVDSFDVVNGMITAAIIEGMGSHAMRSLSQALKENNLDADEIGQNLESSVKELGKSFKKLFQSSDGD